MAAALRAAAWEGCTSPGSLAEREGGGIREDPAPVHLVAVVPLCEHPVGPRPLPGRPATAPTGTLQMTVRPPRSLARFAKRSAKRFGVHVTRDPVSLLQQETLRHIVDAYRINCVIDVGAHRGEFAALLRGTGYHGRIASFEPIAENVQQLEQARANDPSWEVFQIALGSRSGVADMRLFKGSTFHSLLDSSAFGRQRFGEQLELQRVASVRLERLDNILDQVVEGISEPRIFLKTDTQGFDLEVIRGLGDRIDRVEAIQVELTTQPLYEHVTNPLIAALTELQGLGFNLSGIFPVVFGADGVSVIEFDCIMCRPMPREA